MNKTKIVKFPTEFLGATKYPKRYEIFALLPRLMEHSGIYLGPHQDGTGETLSLRIWPSIVSVGGVKLAQVLSENIGIQRLLIDMFYYKECGKNYYLSKSLVEVMKSTKLENVKVSSLPNKGSYQIKLATPIKDTTGALVEDIFVTLVPREGGGTHFNCAWVENASGVGHAYYCLNDGKSLIETIEHYGYKNSKEAMYPFMSFILNSIIYIESTRDMFLEEKNDFSGLRELARTRERATYSTLPFYKFDIDVEFVRLITTTEFGVSGHFRWQPCGVGREQVKLTFVRPHTRSRTV